MSASFTAFIAPLVALSFSTPDSGDDWNIMLATLAPIAFALGLAIREGPLDAQGLRATRRLRAMRPALATLVVGMVVLSPMALVASGAVLLTGGLSTNALLVAAATPLSLGAVAVFLIRIFWPAD